MSAQPVLLTSVNTALTPSLSTQTPSLPLWDRISQWASEHKAVVYTIAGVAVVISGAGVVYYLSDSRKGAKEDLSEDVKKASKKERRRAKKEKEREQEQAGGRGASDQPPRPAEQGRLYRRNLPIFSNRVCREQKESAHG
jgi:mitochondrial import receptor subunit TOM70